VIAAVGDFEDDNGARVTVFPYELVLEIATDNHRVKLQIPMVTLLNAIERLQADVAE
jgi:hypothetical protein